MIINITYPSRFKRMHLYFKTKKYFKDNCKVFPQYKCRDEKETVGIFIKKESLNLIFNEKDAESIKLLREYINYLFHNSIIGVNSSNLITSHLENVIEFIY